MELLVLSSLEWKMNPVTPFSFFDHIITRLELESCPHWEFLRCDCLFHSIVTDSRILCYLPSVVATAIMCLVIKEVDVNNALEYRNQLLGILKISKERVNECCNLITELLGDCGYKKYVNHKRKYCHVPTGPNVDFAKLEELEASKGVSSDDKSRESFDSLEERSNVEREVRKVTKRILDFDDEIGGDAEKRDGKEEKMKVRKAEKKRTSEGEGSEKKEKKKKRVNGTSEEMKLKEKASNKQKEEKERKAHLEQLHTESERLLRETNGAGFKPVPVVQKMYMLIWMKKVMWW
ncbi:hypothetical protein ACET3Z_003098 [Daucus carota]